VILFVAGWCHGCGEPFVAPVQSNDRNPVWYCRERCRKAGQRRHARERRASRERQVCPPRKPLEPDQPAWLGLPRRTRSALKGQCLGKQRLTWHGARVAVGWLVARGGVDTATLGEYFCVMCSNWHVGNRRGEVHERHRAAGVGLWAQLDADGHAAAFRRRWEDLHRAWLACNTRSGNARTLESAQ
jgi:hypothetical protein